MRWLFPLALAAIPTSGACKPQPGAPIEFKHHVSCTLTPPVHFRNFGHPMPDHLFEALEVHDSGLPTGRFIGVRDIGTGSVDDAAKRLEASLRASWGSQPNFALVESSAVNGGKLLVFAWGDPVMHETHFVSHQHGRSIDAWFALAPAELDAQARASLPTVTCTRR
ncbi:MAG: hypothetical protein JNJ54_06715 [Myxococcaceae bacterium]|nr:hypothetical protein [Myxococcaceae bacterium]